MGALRDLPLAPLLGIVIVVIFATVVGKAASDRGHSYWLFFVLSLVISPILAVLVIASLPYRANEGKFIIPPRHGEERLATEEQRRTLRKLGLKDTRLVANLGARQASTIINQMQTSSPMDWGTFLVALIVCPMAFYFLHKYSNFTILGHSRVIVPGQQEEAAPGRASSIFGARSPAPTLVPRSPPGSTVVTRAVSVAARYGRITIPVGTQVSVLSAGGGQLTVRYAGDTFTIPAASTNYRP